MENTKCDSVSHLAKNFYRLYDTNWVHSLDWGVLNDTHYLVFVDFLISVLVIFWLVFVLLLNLNAISFFVGLSACPSLQYDF